MQIWHEQFLIHSNATALYFAPPIPGFDPREKRGELTIVRFKDCG